MQQKTKKTPIFVLKRVLLKDFWADHQFAPSFVKHFFITLSFGSYLVQDSK
jgi:hypothetical protein